MGYNKITGLKLKRSRKIKKQSRESQKLTICKTGQTDHKRPRVKVRFRQVSHRITSTARFCATENSSFPRGKGLPDLRGEFLWD